MGSASMTLRAFLPRLLPIFCTTPWEVEQTYFCVGEYIDWGTTANLDAWASATQNRSGTFDYNFRNQLLALVESNGFFDMGSLPDAQRQNRYKTVPFVNNHDVYRGVYWDSAGNSSQSHDQRTGDWAKNSDELAATIDPDNPRAPLAYAAAFAVDGSPQVYYEDILVNFPVRGGLKAP